ncbi:hypothetical protein MASR2M17_04970 [Aminivibrio sp.]
MKEARPLCEGVDFSDSFRIRLVIGNSGPFFGRPLFTAAGPAAMAHLAGVPVVPVVSYQIAPLPHRVIISPSFSEDGRGQGDILRGEHPEDERRH